MKINKDRAQALENKQKTALRNQLAESTAAFLSAGRAISTVPAGKARKF